MNEKRIHKPRPVSGFPEWLPEVRMVELAWFDHIRRIFESYGFCNIETPSVEELDVLHAKGEDVDKEIYVIERLHKEDGDKEARLALHFDQTVPLARYTAQHFNELTFPFKRYQMQRVWRGERPQAGRFREFYQCDIDVIAVDNLPLHFDAEMPAIMWEVLSSLPGMGGEKIQIRISNRKILMGFLEGLAIPRPDGTTIPLSADLKAEIVRDIDKLEKLGKKTVLQRIDGTGSRAGIGFGLDGIILPFIELCETAYRSADELEIALTNSRDINTGNSTLKEGIEELSFVMDQLKHLPGGAVVADLSIVRGLDYYTGTVYETVFTGDPGYGSICSGGRYDDLAGSYINKHLPGVGISIGFSRLFDRLRQQGKLPVGAKSPADILMVLPADDRRAEASETARILRERGFNVELYHSAAKIKKQMEYAGKKSIPYVWFPPFEDGQPHEVKNMQTGEQQKADAQTWRRS
ncbi:MAG: histidine--tRNA ligase [Alphaproteobacteria bacterium]|nr:histidine--tRNA ligase [Alphaproteobacteria bacterium]